MKLDYFKVNSETYTLANRQNASTRLGADMGKMNCKQNNCNQIFLNKKKKVDSMNYKHQKIIREL